MTIGGVPPPQEWGRFRLRRSQRLVGVTRGKRRPSRVFSRTLGKGCRGSRLRPGALAPRKIRATLHAAAAGGRYLLGGPESGWPSRGEGGLRKDVGSQRGRRSCGVEAPCAARG